MRRLAIIIGVIGSLVGMFVLVYMRDTVEHAAPAIPDDGDEEQADETEPGSAEDESPEPDAAVAAADGSSPEPEAPEVDERVVRVTGLGWELIAPAVLANGGLASDNAESKFREQGIASEITESANMEGIERALALGGGDEDGADIALVPLASFVHRYERLRALSPRVFFVAGWSVGREALFVDANTDFQRAIGARSVKLVGEAGDPATLLSMAALRWSGVDLRKVELASSSSNDTPFAAIDRSRNESNAEGMRILLTSGDVPRFSPFVVVASEAFLRDHEDLALRWTRGWLGGVRQLSSDVAGAARTLGELSDAPETVALVRRLGQVEFIGLRENAELSGLSGRGAVTLERLFAIHWSVWRESGSITIPAPSAPIHNGVVAGLARTLSPESPTAPATADTSAERLLTIPLPREGQVEQIGLLAGIFPGSAIEVASRRGAQRERDLITQARERYNLAEDRFAESDDLPRGVREAIHILRAP